MKVRMGMMQMMLGGEKMLIITNFSIMWKITYIFGNIGDNDEVYDIVWLS